MKLRRDLLLTLARQDLIDRYAGSIFGGVWAIIRPLVNILIFVLIFSKIMGARLAVLGMHQSEYGYSLYLVSGVLLWNAFAESVLRTLNIFQDKAGLIRKVRISLRELPLYILLTETTIYLLSMVFFVVFLMWIGHPITLAWLWLPVIIAVQAGMAYVIGFAGAILSIYIRDVREVVSIVLQVLFWLTPIVYVIDILPKTAQAILEWNPIYQLVRLHRDIVLFNRTPDLVSLTILAALVCAAAVPLLVGFRVFERDIRDLV